MKRTVTIFCAAFLALGAVGASAADDIYTAAIADSTRPKVDIDRDAQRLPAETLALAGVRPGMIVGELFPGGGYFTRPLSKIVGPKGKVYGFENLPWGVPDDQKMAAELGRGNVVIIPTKFGDIHPPVKLDLFWITQNYHDLHVAKFGAVDLPAFNKRVHDALKPGGIYFILDHQANPGTTEAQIAVLHRIEKDQVVREVTAAGFKLVGEGNFLRRPTDDHTKPIFDKAIKGNTDQYALKFEKI